MIKIQMILVMTKKINRKDQITLGFLIGGKGMFKDCEFEGRCSNEDIECEFCQYNAYACTQDLFEWNGEDEEPTQEELDDAVRH